MTTNQNACMIELIILQCDELCVFFGGRGGVRERLNITEVLLDIFMQHYLFFLDFSRLRGKEN